MEFPTEPPVLAIDLGGTQIRGTLIPPNRAVHRGAAVLSPDIDAALAPLGHDLSLIGLPPTFNDRIGDPAQPRSLGPPSAAATQGVPNP